MAINISEYTNPFDPNTPLTNVYGWLSFIALDIASGSGRMTINLHPNEAAWQGQPLDQINIDLGQLLKPADPAANPPTEAIFAYKLEELMAIPEFAAAYNAIGQILYQMALNHQKIANATIIVPPVGE